MRLSAFMVVLALVVGSASATGIRRASNPTAGTPTKPTPRPSGFSPARAPEFPEGRPYFRTFTDSDGLPQNSIRAMTFDRQGYLWVGTQDGAAVYNGRRWNVVNMPNRTLSNFVRAVLAASDGSLWFGTNGGGVAVLKDGTWTVHDVKSGALRSNQVNTLLETKLPGGEPAIWAGTQGAGLSRFERNAWTHYSKLQGLADETVLSLAKASSEDGTALWIGTNRGLFRFEQERISPFADIPELAALTVLSLLETDTRTLWAGTNGGGLFRWDGNRATVFNSGNGLPNNEIWSLLETADRGGRRTLWAGTFGGGLARLSDDERSVLDTTTGLPDNVVFALAKDPVSVDSRTIWIGMAGGGLARLEDGKWWTVDERSGLPNNRVRCFLETVGDDGARRYWIGTRNGLACFEKGAWKIFSRPAQLPGDMVLCLLETKSPSGGSILWVGTNLGLAKLENGSWTVFDTRSGVPQTLVFALLETAEREGGKHLWVGTYGNGLFRFHDGIWERIQIPVEGATDFVTALAETVLPDGSREMFVGTIGGGLFRLSGGKWSRFDQASGLPNNAVRSLFVSRPPAGPPMLWVGTEGGGAAFTPLDAIGVKWEILSDDSNPALPNNTVYQIVQDAEARLYLTTNRGVACLTPVRTPAENGPKFTATTFTVDDGLPGNECNGGAALVDSRGLVWVGTVAGAAVLNPYRGFENTSKLPLLIERVRLEGEEPSVLSAKDLESRSLAHHQNHLIFEYALLNFSGESKTRYRTQLVGFDDRPSEWTLDWKKEYTNLPSGEFVFRVWGTAASGDTGKPVELRFLIRPAPWRTWWFFAVLTTLFFGSVYGMYSWRIYSLRKRQRRKIEILLKLLESIRVINSQLDLDTALRNIAEESARLVGGEPGGIGLISDGKVVFRSLWRQGRWEEVNLSFELGEGVAGMVAAGAKSMIVNQPDPATAFAHQDLAEKYSVCGMVDVPIVSRSGKTVGVLDVRRRQGGRPFTPADCKLVESLAHQAAVVVENAALYGELEKLYRREQQVRQSVEELDRMKTNFMMVASHEMRTPLTVLWGYTEALLSGWLGKLNPVQTESVETCRRMVDRMVSSFDDILETMKINEGRISLKTASFDLCASVKAGAGELRPFFEKRGQRLVLDVPDVLTIDGDREKIELVLLNLIQNAVKFTPDGGVIAVRVASAGEDEVEIVVEDSGIGIAEGELSKIFDKFYTSADSSTHTSGRFEFSARGSGLGLSIAKSYVEAHGGRIWAESDGEGKGSRFLILLPRSGAEISQVPRMASGEVVGYKQ